MMNIEDRMDLAYAMVFAELAHSGQYRTSVNGKGEPYFNHVLRVAKALLNKGFSYSYVVTGLFHDIYEDTKMTKENIQRIVANNELAEIIHQSMLLLTKSPDIKKQTYGMHMYIKNIKESTIMTGIKEPYEISIPLAVKLEDRIDNLTSALDNTSAFAAKYIAETEKYFIGMAKDTIYEKELAAALDKLKIHYKKMTTEAQVC